MELMHHYTSITYATLSEDSDVQKVLQRDLPRLGFQHKFLLHQLLAFSGYHLAYLNQDNRHAFFSQASQHQNCAIEGLRIVLASAHISEHCHALYAASIMLIICSFATYPSYDRFNGTSDPVDNIIGVFSLIKGMNMIRLESGGEISTGPLATLFGRMQSGGPSDKDSGLKIIRAHVEQLSITLGQTTVLENDDIHDSFGIKHAIMSLLNAIENSIRRPSPTSTVSLRASFSWPILLGTEYIASLRQRHPSALVVLAFYCTVLQTAEASCWALEGWAESSMKCVCKSLEGSQWETLIEWPKQFVLDLNQEVVVES
ncbi:fungal Zn binuclear cluster domain-containing protein [Fusarium pseudocircinatum]|uniref:Fungal Zn binuclear cluster domain-containing protein n=1 Tax=Fusarium pseudocircinatum TaxID=56676 RepID=A0A8H5NQZ3_9HYPO|nr:fungal Zn binuclear cluster domain-containing protein [Fusarium pseudocircinatum]